MPTISSFTPSSGAHGITVTINGNNFTGATWVGLVRYNFFTYKSPTWTVVSNTKITATVPSAPQGLAKWRVKTNGGTATSAASFNVTG